MFVASMWCDFKFLTIKQDPETMESTLFTTLTVNEEVSLSGGYYGEDYYKEWKKWKKGHGKPPAPPKPEPPKPPTPTPTPKPAKHPAAVVIIQIGNDVAIGINNGTVNINN
jgi:hypothetical protein